MVRKGQVTAFVIVGLIIVGVIFVLAILRGGSPTLREQDFDNPESYLSTCIRERARVILDQMLEGGGFVEPTDTVLYDTEHITYLCKNINNFDPCINQYPLYVQRIEQEFNSRIENDAKQCFSNLIGELEDRNYEVSQSEEVNIEAKLKPEIIQLTFNAELSMSKSGVYRSFSRFDTYIPSKIQSMGFVANEIINQEAKWCYFSHGGFMTLYPEYDIRVYMMEDTTKIYTIKNEKTGETLKMATRGCALPAGWF